MKKTVFGLLVATALVALSACNTIAGIGEDVEAAGRGIQSGAETVEEELSEDS